MEYQQIDAELRAKYGIDRLRGDTSDDAKIARAAYRADKAAFRERKAIERMNKGKIRPWALTRIDAKGNVKPLLV